MRKTCGRVMQGLVGRMKESFGYAVFCFFAKFFRYRGEEAIASYLTKFLNVRKNSSAICECRCSCLGHNVQETSSTNVVQFIVKCLSFFPLETQHFVAQFKYPLKICNGATESGEFYLLDFTRIDGERKAETSGATGIHVNELTRV